MKYFFVEKSMENIVSRRNIESSILSLSPFFRSSILAMESRCIFPVFSIEQNVPINGIARVVSLELIRETEAKLYREIVRGEKYMEGRKKEEGRKFVPRHSR